MVMDLTRNFNTTTGDALAASQVIAAPVLYLNFPDKDDTGPDTEFQKYYAGSTVDIVIPVNDIIPDATYIGVGGISAISTIEETSELKAPKLTVELNGIDSTYISLVLAENYYGGDATLALVLLGSDHAILTDSEPVILFKGFMSILTLAMSEGKANITLELESILADWERPRVNRYNTGTQRNIDPNDRGFDNVADIISKEIIWRG